MRLSYPRLEYFLASLSLPIQVQCRRECTHNSHEAHWRIPVAYLCLGIECCKICIDYPSNLVRIFSLDCIFVVLIPSETSIAYLFVTHGLRKDCRTIIMSISFILRVAAVVLSLKHVFAGPS